MKYTLYILTAIFLFTSCRSIDKMIESGNYDQALRYGVDKLRGEKNKKTKYVKGLEKAYAKLNRKDLEEIKHLTLQNNKNSMDRVVAIYINMKDRQNYVYPLIPLVSENGYPANFRIQDYAHLINNAKIEASDIHFDTAMGYLNFAQVNNDKLSARKAFNRFDDANTYFDNYRESYSLKKQAYELGQTHILIEPYVSGSNAAFYHTGEIISQLQLNSLNTTWRKYYSDNVDLNIDYIATIEVAEIVPGKEVERYSSFTNTKEVIDGRKPLKNKKGIVIRDTLGNIMYTDRVIVVSANIEELIREKTAQMSGQIVIIEANNSRHISTIPINVTYAFEDYSSIFRGDKRALTSEYNNRMKQNCALFPTDYDMTTNLAYEYKNAAEAIIKNERLI